MPILNGNFVAYVNRLRTRIARSVLGGGHSLLLRAHPHTAGCGKCSDRISDVPERFSGMPAPVFPVDVVITWVDDSDPAYRKKRDTFCHDIPIESGRYRDNGELYYTLQSLNTYAPWLRKLHLVTDGQCPSWLGANFPKVHVVDHRDFIPGAYLPTFNSHVIEAFLHCLPGLSEHYIYFNDDVFLGRPAQKSDFFAANGIPYCFMDWRPMRKFGYGYRDSPHSLSWSNTLKFLVERGVLAEGDPGFISAHGPFPQTIANARDTFAFYEEFFLRFLTNRVRASNEMAFYCHAAPLWLYAQKRIAPCDERYFYVNNSQIDRNAYYNALIRSQKTGTPPLFFCINDTGNKAFTSWYRKDMRRVLYEYFRGVSGKSRG